MSRADEEKQALEGNPVRVVGAGSGTNPQSKDAQIPPVACSGPRKPAGEAQRAVRRVPLAGGETHAAKTGSSSAEAAK